MILNSEQLPNINRTFGGGASWLDYETTSPRGTADIGTISPRNLKQKERPNSSKTMSSLSANLFLDSNDPNTAYASSPLYPSSTEDHSQRLDRFSGTITNDGMSRGNNHHVFGHHSIATPGNVFLSQPSQYDYSDEFSQHIGGGSNSMNNALSSSPIWYQSLSSREGLGSGEELSPYDLSPRQTNSHWSTFSQNQCTDHTLTNIGLYSNVEGINDDTTLELAQRVLQYPISNDSSQTNSGGGGRVQENGVTGGSNHLEIGASEHRLQHGSSQQSANIAFQSHQSHAWKEVEGQLVTNNKCITIPGGGTLQALHPVAPGQRSVSRTSIYSNNSSTSDRGSPSMAMLSNFDPTNPSIPIQVSGVNPGNFPQRVDSVGGSSNERPCLESVSSNGGQRSIESLQGMSHQFGANGARGTRVVNPTLAHNMDELEIISSVSSESNPLSTDQNISANLSEIRVSNVCDGGKNSVNKNRKPSTD